MSDQPPPPAGDTATAEKPAKGPNKLILPIVVVLMTVVGGLVGLQIIGPNVIAARAAKVAGLEPKDGKEGGEPGEGKGDGAEKGPMFKITNLIVNPAGSQGSRFLMVSVAVETPDGKVQEDLQAREPQIRDVVIALLEKQTMEGLAVPGARDSIKALLADTISAIVGHKSRLKVFLPQFVVQ